MTTVDVLRRAAPLFFAQPGSGRFFSDDGAVCSVGAVALARGAAPTTVDELVADEWPEIRALAQAIDQLGVCAPGPIVLRFTSPVVVTSDFHVDEWRAGRGDLEPLRRIWARAIAIESKAAA